MPALLSLVRLSLFRPAAIIRRMNERRHFDLIIFDMDGTLTIDALDFDHLRQRLGIHVQEPVLEWIAELPPGERESASISSNA